jgi:hypothetical protein
MWIRIGPTILLLWIHFFSLKMKVFFNFTEYITHLQDVYVIQNVAYMFFGQTPSILN